MKHDDDFYRREADDITREMADVDRKRAQDEKRRPRVLALDDAELASQALADAVDVIAEGQAIAKAGINYLVKGLIPNYGMLGMLIAYAKVGKTTFGQALGASVAMGHDFLDLTTTATRVLVIAAEDPEEYTAYTARHLQVDRGVMTFYRRSHILNPLGLEQIVGTIRKGKYGFVLMASWQALVRGLVRDENDNSGMVRVVEDVKAAARKSGVPWLIDAHAGKGEDQTDDADPSKAMRGASGAAGAADYALWLRYGNGTFGTQRRLSGKGRFVTLAPLTLDYNPDAGTYAVLGSTKQAATDTTWRLICEIGAITETPRSAAEIARSIGLLGPQDRMTGTVHKRISAAVSGQPDVGVVEEIRRGQKTKLYRRLV